MQGSSSRMAALVYFKMAPLMSTFQIEIKSNLIWSCRMESFLGEAGQESRKRIIKFPRSTSQVAPPSYILESAG